MYSFFTEIQGLHYIYTVLRPRRWQNSSSVPFALPVILAKLLKFVYIIDTFSPSIQFSIQPPWRRRQHVSMKQWNKPDILHGVKIQELTIIKTGCVYHTGFTWRCCFFSFFTQTADWNSTLCKQCYSLLRINIEPKCIMLCTEQKLRERKHNVWWCHSISYTYFRQGSVRLNTKIMWTNFVPFHATRSHVC